MNAKHNELYSNFRNAVGQLVDDATNNQKQGENHDCDPLIIALEAILTDGLIEERSLFSISSYSVWDFIEQNLNSPDIKTTVLSLTEDNPENRLRTYIKMALLQQILSSNLEQLYSIVDLQRWYLPTSFIQQPDKKEAIIGMLQGLNKLYLNIYIEKEQKIHKLKSFQNFGLNILSKGRFHLDGAISNIGNVQTQIVGTATENVNYFLYQKSNNDDVLKSLKDTNAVLTLELEGERKKGLGLSMQLIQLKMASERENRKLRQQVAKMETLLEQNNIEYKPSP